MTPHFVQSHLLSLDIFPYARTHYIFSSRVRACAIGTLLSVTFCAVFIVEAVSSATDAHLQALLHILLHIADHAAFAPCVALALPTIMRKLHTVLQQPSSCTVVPTLLILCGRMLEFPDVEVEMNSLLQMLLSGMNNTHSIFSTMICSLRARPFCKTHVCVA